MDLGKKLILKDIMRQSHLDRIKYKGFVSVVSVIILLAVVSVVILTVYSSQMNRIQSNKMIQSEIVARANATSCAEIALSRLRLDINYAAAETINLDYGSCSIIRVVSTGADTRNLEVTGTYDTHVKKLDINLQKIVNRIEVTSWLEVADF